MKLKYFIAVLSMTLTAPLVAEEVVKGIAIPLDYTSLYIIDEKSVDAKNNKIDKKPYFIRLVGVQSAGQYIDNEPQSWAILNDLVELASDNPAEVICQMFDNEYYGNNDSGICSINGKDIAEQLIATGFYAVNRSETYRKGMDIGLAKRYDAAEKQAREQKLGIWSKVK